MDLQELQQQLALGSCLSRSAHWRDSRQSRWWMGTGTPAMSWERSLPQEELPLPCTGASISASQAVDHNCETKEKPYNKNISVQLQLSWQLLLRLWPTLLTKAEHNTSGEEFCQSRDARSTNFTTKHMLNCYTTARSHIFLTLHIRHSYLSKTLLRTLMRVAST